MGEGEVEEDGDGSSVSLCAAETDFCSVQPITAAACVADFTTAPCFSALNESFSLSPFSLPCSFSLPLQGVDAVLISPSVRTMPSPASASHAP